MVWEAFNLKDNHYFGQETGERGCRNTLLRQPLFCAFGYNANGRYYIGLRYKSTGYPFRDCDICHIKMLRRSLT